MLSNRASDDPKYWFFLNGEWVKITHEEYRLKATQQANYRNLATSHTVTQDYEDYYDVHP